MRVFSLFGRPAFLRRLHGVLTLFWLALWVVATKTNWVSHTEYVSHLSQAALVLGSWSSWQAARTEELQEKMIEESTEGGNNAEERDPKGHSQDSQSTDRSWW